MTNQVRVKVTKTSEQNPAQRRDVFSKTIDAESIDYQTITDALAILFGPGHDINFIIHVL